MLTAMNEDSNRIDGLKIGADDYLAKPFESNDLSKGIEWVLKSKDYKNISLRSRKRAQKLWSEEIIISKYERIYEKVLNNSIKV